MFFSRQERLPNAGVKTDLFVDSFARRLESLVPSATSFIEDGTDKPVMEIKDLIGQSRTCFEKDGYQCPIATWIVEAGEVLCSRSRGSSHIQPKTSVKDFRPTFWQASGFDSSRNNIVRTG